VLRYDWARSFKEITRRSSASPATGYSVVHKKEQDAIIAEAFNV
jgi:2-oxoglutarate dehydrogenase complex dehydrogenase (E1) component-like enzyme